MKFNWGNSEFVIVFARRFKKVPSGYDAVKQEVVYKSTKYPYTTVTLYRKDLKLNTCESHRTATVGVYHHDKVSKHGLLEGSRLKALKAISKTMAKELKKAMWYAYFAEKEAQRKLAEEQRKLIAEGKTIQKKIKPIEEPRETVH